MFRVYLLFLIMTTSVALAQISYSSIRCHQQRNPKIVGGHGASQHEMPFVVSLQRRNGHFCGATIIHERWMLTAGHCICNGLNRFMKPSQLQGVVGLHSMSEYLNSKARGGIAKNLNLKPFQVHFTGIVPHPNYECESVKNDIALLELERPIQFTHHVQPACVGLNIDERLHENELAIVAGWGWTLESQSDGQRADTLQKATVKIWNNDACEKSYQLNGKPNSFISDKQLCAGFENGGIDSCWADSGGPLMDKDGSLIGIVSTGVGCARPGLPGVYTRVSKYIQWIDSVIINQN